MAGKFVIDKAKNGKFYFVLKAANGQVILQSQMYAALADARDGIESVRKNCADPARFQKTDAKNGQPYFTLTATNGQVIGQSEMYTAASGRDNGIASVQRNAPQATIDDSAVNAPAGGA